MTIRLRARLRLALAIIAGLAVVSLPAAAQQQQLYGGSGYGTSAVGAYNPYTQSGPGQTTGRPYGAAPVAPYPPAYGRFTPHSPPPRPATGPRGAYVHYAQPPAGQVGAYNPWRPQPVGGHAPSPGSRPPAAYGRHPDADPGANLPPPPPGPIRSRLLSIPEVGNPQGSAVPFQTVPYVPRRSGAVRQPPAPRRTTTAAAPPPQTAGGRATDSPPPAPAPTPRITLPPSRTAAAKPAAAPDPPKSAPLPPAPVVARPAEPPKPAAAAVVERPPQPVAAPTPVKPAANGTTRVVFEANTPALSPDARAALDKLAADLIASPGRRTTIKAYSAGGSAPETRRLSLARGLAVRAYLIDKGVPRERLDVQALGASANGGPADRVDVVIGAGT